MGRKWVLILIVQQGCKIILAVIIDENDIDGLTLGSG